MDVQSGSRPMKKLKTGLVLGGGGARGLAHIGVLQVLQSAGIQIDVVVGSSMGAIVGAVYAQHPDVDYVERKFRSFLLNGQETLLGAMRYRRSSGYEPDRFLKQISKEFKRRVVINLAAHRKSLLKPGRLANSIRILVEEGTIDQLTLPFACSAVDLISGEDIIFQSGDLYQALSASAAIPGILPPVEIGQQMLIDGSVTNNFPIETAREMGADIVLAVNVSADIDSQQNIENVVDVIMRSNAAASRKLNISALHQADFVLSPPTGSVYWADFENIDQLIQAGRQEMQRRLPELQRILRRRSSIIGRWDNWLLGKLRRHIDRRMQK